MALHCPFCHAEEEARVGARDDVGDDVVLVLFRCPFFYRFKASKLTSDDEAQVTLKEWKDKDGEAWLERVGPLIREREIRNVDKYLSSQSKLKA